MTWAEALSWCNRMPLSPALEHFSRNFWRTCGRATVVYHWYCCHMTTCNKESEHHFFPTLFALFTLTGRSSLGEHPDRRVTLRLWIILVNPGLVTCNDLIIAVRVPIVESPKYFTAPFHLSDLLTISETVWHPAR